MLFVVLQSALGCDLSTGSDAIYLEPDPSDTVPPGPSALVDVFVARGSSGIACGNGIASVEIWLERPAGDPDAHDDIGYRVEVVAGDPPFDVDPSELLGGPDVRWIWDDGGAFAHEPIDVTLSLAPVDAGGNVGEALLVDVVDGTSGCGCAGGPLRAAGLPLLLFVAGASRRARGAGVGRA